MKRKTIVRLATVALAFTFAVGEAPAQGPGGNQLRGGRPAAATDRVQDQVNQRVQAQTQQRVQGQVQAQVQSRTQSQIQGRIQSEAKRAAEVAQRAVENSARRASSMATGNASARGNSTSGISTSGNSTSGNSPARVNVNANIAATAAGSRVEGVSETDLVIYDNIFGRFNPMRPETNERAKPNAAASAKANGQGPQNFDVARGIQVAAQKRRAEISQLRDQAIATGQDDLMVRADEMEQRLNAFVETHQQLERGRAGQDAPLRTATRAAGSLDGSTRLQN